MTDSEQFWNMANSTVGAKAAATSHHVAVTLIGGVVPVQFAISPSLQCHYQEGCNNSVVIERAPLPNTMCVTGSVAARALSSDSMANYSTRVTNGTVDVIFDLYRNRDTETLSVHELLKSLHKCGIREDDPRLNSFIRAVADEERRQLLSDLPPSESIAANLDRDTFKRCVSGSIGIIAKALKKHLVVPDWSTFVTVVTEIFESCRDVNDGKVADYIPQLARSNPSNWAISICTVDGQRRSWGNSSLSFTLQSVCKPFTYAIALEELGADEVHGYVGQEPSGRLFNEICLNHNKKPHNPMINAGAILVVSLLKRNSSLSDRFDFALQQLKNFACNGYVGFNNAVFLSERETADRNYALSYYMREHKCFPRNTSLQDTLDLYFQLCSIETNTDTLAVMAATLANGGVSPLGAKRVVCNRAVRDTLSLMYSCGMYDYSGQFAFTVGLPAKSGVSGDLMIVVPNVMGIGIYSPPLDSLGNTVRGVKFAKQLVEKFNFHNYDSLVYSETNKIDPRKEVREVHNESISNMMYAAKTGDISAIQRYILLGVSIYERDYDERTVLHIAAAEGNVSVLKFLLERWEENPGEYLSLEELALLAIVMTSVVEAIADGSLDPEDRYGRTPLDDAKQFGWEKCVEVLSEAHKSYKRGTSAVAARHTANSSITNRGSDSQKDAISSVKKGALSSDIYNIRSESRNASSTQANISPTIAKSLPKSKNIHSASSSRSPSAAVLVKKPDERPTEQ
uniref:glutaminase n=1 Tax=Ascaris lumbricoides TaxID=6252 RepID=A0A0M3HMM9_ASCLU